jgi:hypothetical protein
VRVDLGAQGTEFGLGVELAYLLLLYVVAVSLVESTNGIERRAVTKVARASLARSSESSLLPPAKSRICSTYWGPSVVAIVRRAPRLFC